MGTLDCVFPVDIIFVVMMLSTGSGGLLKMPPLLHLPRVLLIGTYLSRS